jgi:hypothetical protein
LLEDLQTNARIHVVCPIFINKFVVLSIRDTLLGYLRHKVL